MEKELEELKSIVLATFGALGFFNPSKNEEILKDRDKVLNALTELQSIKEAKHSEALACLENLVDYYDVNYDIDDERYQTIKQALLKAQENEKVLEILKPLCEVVETPIRKNRYLKINGVVVYTFKNEEEFNLVKRWSETVRTKQL